MARLVEHQKLRPRDGRGDVRGHGRRHHDVAPALHHQDRQIEEMVRAARTFRTLTPAEAAALQPYRLRIVSPAGSTPAQLAARMPYPDLKMERLLVLNAAETPAELASRTQIKLIEP